MLFFQKSWSGIGSGWKNIPDKYGFSKEYCAAFCGAFYDALNKKRRH